MVIGTTRSSFVFADHLNSQVTSGTVYHAPFPDFTFKCDYIYSEQPVSLSDFSDDVKALRPINEVSNYGLTVCQEELTNYDWQATRDIERQLLAMHEAGIWQMPDDVRQRMLAREQMRSDVDREIQESSSS